MSTNIRLPDEAYPTKIVLILGCPDNCAIVFHPSCTPLIEVPMGEVSILSAVTDFTPLLDNGMVTWLPAKIKYKCLIRATDLLFVSARL
jgi:hypothetical protein